MRLAKVLAALTVAITLMAAMAVPAFAQLVGDVNVSPSLGNISAPVNLGPNCPNNAPLSGINVAAGQGTANQSCNTVAL